MLFFYYFILLYPLLKKSGTFITNHIPGYRPRNQRLGICPDFGYRGTFDQVYTQTLDIELPWLR